MDAMVDTLGATLSLADDVAVKSDGTVERPALHVSQTRDAWLNGERNGSMVIPPGQTATFEVSNTLGGLLPRIARVTGVDPARIRGLEVHSVNLHMHAVGQSGVIQLRDRSNRQETLLSVPRYDFNWQTNYHLAKPLRLPAGSRIDCTAQFDNSTENPNNPDATKSVMWGEQTWQEMMIGFVDYAFVREKK